MLLLHSTYLSVQLTTNYCSSPVAVLFHGRVGRGRLICWHIVLFLGSVTINQKQANDTRLPTETKLWLDLTVQSSVEIPEEARFGSLRACWQWFRSTWLPTQSWMQFNLQVWLAEIDLTSWFWFWLRISHTMRSTTPTHDQDSRWYATLRSTPNSSGHVDLSHELRYEREKGMEDGWCSKKRKKGGGLLLRWRRKWCQA